MPHSHARIPLFWVYHSHTHSAALARAQTHIVTAIWPKLEQTVMKTRSKRQSAVLDCWLLKYSPHLNIPLIKKANVCLNIWSSAKITMLRGHFYSEPWALKVCSQPCKLNSSWFSWDNYLTFQATSAHLLLVQSVVLAECLNAFATNYSTVVTNSNREMWIIEFGSIMRWVRTNILEVWGREINTIDAQVPHGAELEN